jgi:hypothetical protein
LEASRGPSDELETDRKTNATVPEGKKEAKIEKAEATQEVAGTVKSPLPLVKSPLPAVKTPLPVGNSGAVPFGTVFAKEPIEGEARPALAVRPEEAEVLSTLTSYVKLTQALINEDAVAVDSTESTLRSKGQVEPLTEADHSAAKAAAAVEFDGGRQLDKRQLDERQLDERQLDERQLDERQLNEHQLDERQLDERQLDERQLNERQLDERQRIVFEEQTRAEARAPMEEESTLALSAGSRGQEKLRMGGQEVSRREPRPRAERESAGGGGVFARPALEQFNSQFASGEQ